MACANLDRHGRHELAATPGEADLILAATQAEGFGWDFGALRRSAFYRTHGRKVVGYCPDCHVYPTVPCIYMAVTPYWAASGWACGGHYVSAHIHRHALDPGVPPMQRDLLFSFVGSSNTHPVRERLLRLEHPRSFLSDVAPKNSPTEWYQRDPRTVEALLAQFGQVLGRTKFALCPRGLSPSSIRLFEAMEAGCVPVVVADRLVLPEGPDWEEFCVRVPEREIASIPAMLASMEERFEPMARAARAAWERYFSPESTFDSLANWGADILDALEGRRRARLEWQVRVGGYTLPANLGQRRRHGVKAIRTGLARLRANGTGVPGF